MNPAKLSIPVGQKERYEFTLRNEQSIADLE